MQNLELKLPPILVFIIGAVVIYCVEQLVPNATLALPVPNLVASLLFIASGVFGIGALYQFYRAKTTVNPVDIDKVTAIVCLGVYRLSRNPMYLGLLLLLLAFSYWLQNGLALLVNPLFIFYMNRYQILPEEKIMQRKFGQAYIDYKSRVRRWL